MRSRAPIVIIIVLLTHTLRSQSLGQDYARRGAYAGGGFTYGVTNFDTTNLESPPRPALDVSDSLGFHLYGGYRVHARAAAEGELEYYDDAAVKVKNHLTASSAVRSHDDKLGDVSGYVFTGNGKLFLSTGRLQPYGVFGLGFVYGTGTEAAPCHITSDPLSHLVHRECFLSGSDVAFVMRFGGGVDFYLTPEWVVDLSISYVKPTGDLGRFDYIPIGAGLQYRF